MKLLFLICAALFCISGVVCSVDRDSLTHHGFHPISTANILFSFLFKDIAAHQLDKPWGPHHALNNVTALHEAWLKPSMDSSGGEPTVTGTYFAAFRYESISKTNMVQTLECNSTFHGAIGARVVKESLNCLQLDV